MAILNAYNLDIHFGDTLLFSNVNFEIGEKERVGLVGSNGTGKTTLFKLITGELEPTDGQIIKSKDVKLGYMEQHACADSTRTIYDEMLTVFDSLIETECELDEITRLIDSGSGDLNELIQRQTYLTEQFERNDGLVFRSRTRAVLIGLGFPENEFSLRCSELSGGQRSKLSLGKLLLSGPDLLLLDEPTNHLDITSVEWLERFLDDYTGAAIIISHDRYFLDRVTNKTMDFFRNRLRTWKGNYSVYMKLREEQRVYEERLHAKQMDEIKHIEGIIEQQKRFGRERNFITIASKQKMLDKKLEELVTPESTEAEVRFKFKPVIETGNEVAVLKSLSKGFGEKRLFRDVSVQINKHERAFLLGPNGCGKTTMLRILINEIKADSGYFTLGSNVRIGYFDQSLSGLHNEKTVIDEIWDLHRSMNMTEVRNALAMFLFRGDDVYKTVGELSGGEKARVALLKLVLSGANFLLLDEPTNHLDINSREALETALLGYGGTMLVVSHDRYFINKLCTCVMQLTHDGIERYVGNYDDYVRRLSEKTEEKIAALPIKVNEYKQRKERESEKRRIAGKLKRCEESIESVEAEITQKTELMSLPEVASDYERVLELTDDLEKLHTRQDSLMLEWEQLQEQADELNDEA